MSQMRLNQKGLTLVELVIAMTVGAMIAGAVVASMFQLFTVSDRNSNYNAAFTQVQNAGYWVSQDAVQAQEVTLTPDFITLDWVDWEGDAHQVVYTLEGASDGLKELKRSYYIKDSPESEFVLQQTIIVAQYIDPANTSCTWDGNVLTLVITAQVGDQTVTRTYKVEPRPLS